MCARTTLAWPGTRAPSLETEAIVAAALACGRPSTVGIGNGESGLVALFWVDVGSVLVIGVEEGGSG
jgi:hypothetical protein